MIRLLSPHSALLRAVALVAALPVAALAAGDTGSPTAIGVGVAEFEHEGYRHAGIRYGADGVAAAARGLVERELGNHARVALIERSRLADLLEEISFQQSGVTTPEGAAEIGVGHNVQLLVFGQVARRSPIEYRLALRVVDVATGRVLRAEEMAVPREGPAFERVVRAVARRLIALALASLPADDILVPASAFSMGSTRYPEEGPVHVVNLGTFRIDRTEVSRGTFFAWLESHGRPAIFPEEPDLPATQVSWHDASAYCGWVGKRLPTEAEWERAARGPSGRTYPWGASAPSPHTALYAAGGHISVFGLPAGASQEGILQLSGNVAEWVVDWYDPGYYSRSPETNPRGPDEGDFKVVRGGGFSSTADELSTSARGFHNAVRGADHIGFRCAASVPSKR